MPTYECTTILNQQDGPSSEFEKTKREILAMVDPESHHCMVKRDSGKIEVVRFFAFGKTSETNELFIIFHRITEFSAVRSERCWPSQVCRMNDMDFQWPEDQISRVGYTTTSASK